MNIPMLIFLMMLATFSARLIPALFIDKMHFTDKMYTFLKLIPFTAMTALIFPGILSADENHISVGIIGGLVAFIAVYKKLPTIVVVILSIVAVYLLYMCI